MKPETVAEFDKASKGMRLPARVGAKITSLKQLRSAGNKRK